ncbi:SIR2 family protein [Undibacterium sp.]|uniref:SIR2 family protein n=1 Tax=Undibacterium sp. TaxID=1914977 RepID=UPI003753602A
MFAGDADCRFRRALESVLALANPSAEELAHTDLEKPIEDWPDIDNFCTRLISVYSNVLDVTVEGEESDYLLWSGIGVTQTYADPLITPDAEHLCIAILAIEGAASDIASANWDGLIEKAISELSTESSLAVFVRAEDTRGIQQSPKLYKFHGCAIKAKDDELNYRHKLVAQKSQISGWATRPENAVIANRLIDIATTKRTLMMGLSAQDSNIQGIFVQSQNRMAWPWPSLDLAYVFSENALGNEQLGLLKNVYPTAYTPINRTAIYQESLIQAYAKPLLVALVLHVLSSKICALATQAPGLLNIKGRDEINQGITTLRDFISERVETLGHEPFIRELIAQSERSLQLYREGNEPPTGSKLYKPLSNSNVQVTLRDVNLPANGLRELGVGIGLIGLGLRDRHWTIDSSDRNDSKSGALSIKAATSKVQVFFASTPYVAVLLKTNGHIADDDNAVVIHSLGLQPISTRSPRSVLGRTGKPKLRHISVADLMNTTSDAALLFERFREETTL